MIGLSIRVAIAAFGTLVVVTTNALAETTRLCDMSVDYKPNPRQSAEVAGVWQGSIGVVTGQHCVALAVIGLSVKNPNDHSIYVRYVWNAAMGHGIYNQNNLGDSPWKITPLGNNRYEMIGNIGNKIELEMTRDGHLEGKHTMNGLSFSIYFDKLR